ncbi:hypothetical protein FGO68_gene11657 [Halteria grandinella]|uniref:Uncharacterized protein n=1 Tax=Halteria grandinella TaxID=5974 RepID=A0A8J8NF69_HALGN|nr:hypothetical protein FGO68_gene11657 [Halteria grandinella]
MKVLVQAIFLVGQSSIATSLGSLLSFPHTSRNHQKSLFFQSQFSLPSLFRILKYSISLVHREKSRDQLFLKSVNSEDYLLQYFLQRVHMKSLALQRIVQVLINCMDQLPPCRKFL